LGALSRGLHCGPGRLTNPDLVEVEIRLTNVEWRLKNIVAHLFIARMAALRGANRV